eukprot:4994837-Ditylum_brightwellii.AAC.1
MCNLFDSIKFLYNSRSTDEGPDEEDDDFFNFIESSLMKKSDDYPLSVFVFSYIKPTLRTHFLLHVLLSIGHFSTDIDLTMHPSLQGALNYAKLTGPSNNEDDLKKYSNDLLLCYIKEQIIYFPNTKRVIDEWVIVAGKLFDSVIIHDTIPMSDLPLV